MNLYRCLFWVAEVLALGVILLPICTYLLNGWEIRRQEFTNRFTKRGIEFYLRKFWPEQYLSYNETFSPAATFNALVFDKVLARRLYVLPGLLLVAIAAICCGLVIQTAMRDGLEYYYNFYKEEAVSFNHSPIGTIDAVFSPFPGLGLNLPSLAALAGAYLYVAGATIQAYRARTLVSSDLMGSSLRFIIAVPMGLSLGELANSSVGGFIAFALGAFPLGAINRILIRLLNRSLNETEEQEGKEAADQLVLLLGVTPQVAAVLNEEGIDSIQQLADTDPVSLALRIGRPFDYVLSLVSQSQAWCYLGGTAKSLQMLGLGDARTIAKLAMRLKNPSDPDAQAILQSAAKASNIDAVTLRQLFDNVAGDPYTDFLGVMSDAQQVNK